MSDADLFRPEDFVHQVTLAVRFGDVDMLGHVNHTKYLTYMEQGRICYARDVLRWDGDFRSLSMILARATVDYLLPLKFAESVYVYTRCIRLGNKSFDLAYLLRRNEDGRPGAVVATGVTNMVAYNYAQSETIAVPGEWRSRILAFEKALQE
jgi:acyl-CoA thioester hydrolase